jgi:hypothetical protein
MSDNPLLDIEGMGDASVSPATAVSALALNFAMKFHDIGTVQDGTLYQQLKLEGKNMQPLHIDMIFETALQFERFILESPNRLSAQVMGAAEDVILDMIENALDAPEEDTPND